jgi:hypothetical protein
VRAKANKEELQPFETANEQTTTEKITR